MFYQLFRDIPNWVCKIVIKILLLSVLHYYNNNIREHTKNILIITHLAFYTKLSNLPLRPRMALGSCP